MWNLRRLGADSGKGWTPLIEEQADGSSVAAENKLNKQREQSLQASTQGTVLAFLLGDDASLIAAYVEDVELPDPARSSDLQRHLQELQETVLTDLLRLQTSMEAKGLMGTLLECYHRRVCEHLGLLLQVAKSTKDYFGLMEWVLRRYHSQELLMHPDLQSLDPLKQINPLLLAEWTTQAKSKLLESVQRDIRGHLRKILQEESWRGCRASDNEEDFVRLSVDTIQCLEANPKVARLISSELSKCVREVCFQELLVFVKIYAAEQTKLLRNQSKAEQPEMTQFLKTLKMCQDLRKYVQTGGFSSSVSKEIVTVLHNMEEVTMELLMTNITKLVETALVKYFRSNSQSFCLNEALRKPFVNTSHCTDVLKEVVDETYRIITHLYLKHLIRYRRKKLEARWSQNVAQTVAWDAQMLQDTMQSLAPGVQQWNTVLLRVVELLRWEDLGAVKVEVGTMAKESKNKAEDLDLLPSILKWKGLSRKEVQEVLAACLDVEPPRPWYSCFLCC